MPADKRWNPPTNIDPAKPVPLTMRLINLRSWALSLEAMLNGNAGALDHANLAVLQGFLSDTYNAECPPRFVARPRKPRPGKPPVWGVFDRKHRAFVHVGDGGLPHNRFASEAGAATVARRCEVYALDAD